MNKNQIQKVKFFYYLTNTLSLLIPRFLYRSILKSQIKKLDQHNVESIKSRVDYYNRIDKKFQLSDSAVTNNELFFNQMLKLKKRFVNKISVKKRTTYFFDLYGCFRFSQNIKNLIINLEIS